jgi:hypothetical protein
MCSVEATEERLFDREAILGRDTAAVFPSQRGQGLQAVFEGAPQFVTEAQLAELRAARGGAEDDGAGSAGRPLHEVLRENAEKKVSLLSGILCEQAVERPSLTHCAPGRGVPAEVETHEAGEKQATGGGRG